MNMNQILNIINIIFSIVFILFLPGNIISFIFFPLKNIDLIERIALSFSLSIAIVPLIVFYLNLLGIPINKPSVTLQILLIIIVSLIIILIRHYLTKYVKKR